MSDQHRRGNGNRLPATLGHRYCGDLTCPCGATWEEQRYEPTQCPLTGQHKGQGKQSLPTGEVRA